MDCQLEISYIRNIHSAIVSRLSVVTSCRTWVVYNQIHGLAPVHLKLFYQHLQCSQQQILPQ